MTKPLDSGIFQVFLEFLEDLLFVSRELEFCTLESNTVDSGLLLHSFYLMLLTFKIANPRMYLSYRQSICYLLNTLLVKSKLCALYFLCFYRQKKWRRIWKTLKKKKACLGNIKRHQNCSRTAANSLKHR